MADAEYDLDEDGNIIVFPLLGYTSTLIGGDTILIRLEIARNHDQLRSLSGENEQVAIHPKQALQLSEDLKKAALKAMSVSPTTQRQ